MQTLMKKQMPAEAVHGGHCNTNLVEDTEPYPNSFSKPNHIHKACLFNTLSHIKSIQPVGPREKFNSLHFPETENGRGFDSRLNTRRCVLQLMS